MNDNARVKLNRDYICWQSEILACTELEGARLRQGYARLILITELCVVRDRVILIFFISLMFCPKSPAKLISKPRVSLRPGPM